PGRVPQPGLAAELEDLEAIRTLGFGGEALASIGVVSHTRILSCARGEATGAELEVKGGKRGELKFVGAPEGTLVEVRELFYNVPARRKFLKATPTEMASISEVLTKLALSHPEIHFTLAHNQREVFNLPPSPTVKDRIATFFGQDFAKELLFINSREPTLEVSGYIRPPAQSYGSARMQYTFLNGRYVREVNISHAVQESYRNLLPSGRYPIVFLFLKSEPSLVDVNVHPTKLEVRFREPSKVHGQVLKALKNALTQYTPKISPSLQEAARLTSIIQTQDKTGFPEGLPPSLLQTADTQTSTVKRELQRTPSGPFVQIHRTYIVEETPKGINIVDQHALHEILLYTELKNKILEGQIPVQRLLIPELVELNSNDFFNIIGLQESLARVGAEVEEFGQNTIIVRSLPQMLKDLDIKEFIKDLTERLKEEVEGEHVLDKVLKALACKGAVKSGCRLDPQEIQTLLEKRNSLQAVARCPHGRPTTLFLSVEELDRHFKRRTPKG
ncbi:MAG TPA: DNA mismatch repair endonuclease MutL, partial [Candidatus Hypogeohydataceae bacterium YC40]